MPKPKVGFPQENIKYSPSISSYHLQTQAQNEIIEQQRSRVRELETSVRQLEGRCNDLREAAAGHEQRTKDAQAEVVKGNNIIEKLMVCFLHLPLIPCAKIFFNEDF